LDEEDSDLDEGKISTNTSDYKVVDGLLKFPWDCRWLRGSEYEFIINWYEEYAQKFGLDIVDVHPTSIYEEP
jgi:hypothetical protein